VLVPSLDSGRWILYPTLKALAISHADMHKPGTILIEDAGVGTALAKELQEEGLSAIAVKPAHNKRTRMSVQSNKFANGQVFFPTEAPWRPDLENELLAFPFARHDDQVDSISQALAHEISGYDLEAMVGNTSYMNIFSRYGFPMR
jgi:predicted phage terminase large subunit-like protein